MNILKRSIFAKVLASIIGISLLTGLVILNFTLKQKLKVVETNLIEEHLSLSSIAVKSFEAGYLSKVLPFETLKKISERKPVVFFWIVKPDGRIYLADQPRFFNKKIDLSVTLSPEKPEISDIVFEKEKIKLIKRPIFKELKEPWTFYLGVSLEEINLIRKRIIIGNSLIFILIILFASILSYYLSKTITQPIKKLEKATLRIGKGELVKAEIKSEDEIGKLAESFNQMVENVKKSMEAKSEFLKIINHQLRTPITALRGYLSFWKSEDYQKISKIKQEEIKNNLLKAVDQLSDLANVMIDAMEIEGGYLKLRWERFNLLNFISFLYKNDFENRFQKKGLSFEIKGQPLLIESDKRYLNMVFVNLWDNVCKYTLEGGVNLNLEKENNFAKITIKDTGIGLSEKEKESLFEKFVRGEMSSQISPTGSGLGLYIVKRIINAFKGEIKAYSKGRHQGTTFVIKLPLTQNE